MVRALHVAEKPSVATELANILAGHSAKKTAGHSPYNYLFEFEHQIMDQAQCNTIIL